VVPILLPPLRERKEEIGFLARHFLVKHAAQARSKELALSPEAEAALSRYDFPGNVRELENTIQRALVLAESDGVIRPEHLPKELQGGKKGSASLNRQVEDLEKQLLSDALEKAGGSQTAAAKLLGLSRTLLIYKLKKHKIRPDAFKKSGGARKK
jgi:transcriptional regulator with PAS, ATPase and Fis domain